MLALVAVSVLVGALSQRVTGMGFALVSAPLVVLLLGPYEGVVVVLACGAVSSLIIIPRVWRFIEWRTFAWLVVPAVVAIVPGSMLAAALPDTALKIGIGALVILALSATLLITRAEHTMPARPTALAAGAASGLMNTAAGVGGPALSIYAVLTRWPQAQFAATLQPYFVVIDVVALASKMAFAGGTLPELDAVSWLVIVAALLVGLGIGEALHRHVSHRTARIAVIVIAYLGGAAAVADGLFALAR